LNESSDGEVSVDSVMDARNSIRKYFHDPSLMKKRKPYLGNDSNYNHPMIERSNKKLATDLTKIRNASPVSHDF